MVINLTRWMFAAMSASLLAFVFGAICSAEVEPRGEPLPFIEKVFADKDPRAFPFAAAVLAERGSETAIKALTVAAGSLEEVAERYE